MLARIVPKRFGAQQRRHLRQCSEALVHGSVTALVDAEASGALPLLHNGDVICVVSTDHIVCCSAPVR